MASIPSSYRVPEGDYSGQFLDSLLGKGWDAFGSGQLGGEAGSELMLQIFSAFNMVALCGVSALFLWVVMLSVVGSAHEGTPLGKRFSSLWMPLRFTLSIGGLAPIFKGLSLFQVGILACIGWSINLANFVWEIGTDYFVKHGAQITVSAPMTPPAGFQEVAGGILRSLALQEFYVERRNLVIENRPGSWGYSSKDGGDDAPGNMVFTFAGGTGRVVIECSSAREPMCLARRDAANTAIRSLQAVAASLANPDTPASAIDQQALYRVSGQIQQTLINGVMAKSAAEGSQLGNKLQAFQDAAGNFGWFGAGASYWSISWINQQVKSDMYANFDHYFTGSRSDNDIEAEMYGLSDYHAIDDRVAKYIDSAYSVRRGIPDALGPVITS
jgi:conjugal transfer/type IV secretion protein DotA/TraY